MGYVGLASFDPVGLLFSLHLDIPTALFLMAAAGILSEHCLFITILCLAV
jgi:hypothetical protein